MAVPDITLADPFVADIAVPIRVENDGAGFDVAAHVQDLLFLRVVDLENHMRMIEGHAERDTPRLDQLGNPGNAAEMLGPHVDVDLEGRPASDRFTDLVGAHVNVRDVLVADQVAIGMAHHDLRVVDPAAEAGADLQVPPQQRLVPTEGVEPAPGTDRKVVFLAVSAIVVDQVGGWRRLVEIVVDPGLADHPEFGLEVELILAAGVADSLLGDADEQFLGHSGAPSVVSRNEPSPNRVTSRLRPRP